MLIFYAECQRISVLLHDQFVVSKCNAFIRCEAAICEIWSGTAEKNKRKSWIMLALDERKEKQIVKYHEGASCINPTNDHTIVWIMVTLNQVAIGHINGQVDVVVKFSSKIPSICNSNVGFFFHSCCAFVLVNNRGKNIYHGISFKYNKIRLLR